MRVFVVLASLATLISADVSHLYDAPHHSGSSSNKYQTTSTHYGSNDGVGSSFSGNGFTSGSGHYGSGSGSSSHGSGSGFSSGSTGGHGFGNSGSSGFSTGGFSDPVVNFVNYPSKTTTTTHYQPAVQQSTANVAYETGSYGGDAGFGSTGGSNFGSSGSSNFGSSGSSNFGSSGGNYGSTGFGSGGSGSSSTGFGSGSSGHGHGGSFGSGSGSSQAFLQGGGGHGAAGNLYDSVSSYGGHNYHTKIVKQTDPIVTKHSYVFAAPEDQEDIQKQQTIILPRPRLHYKVIFIKAPASTVVNTPSVALAPQTQEKTLIYVLSDKKRIENHIQLGQLGAPKPQKPEVFFVKYNKPTQVVNSQVKYETVGSVPGAEQGSASGSASVSISGAGVDDRVDDEPQSGPSNLGTQIHQIVSNQGLGAAIQTIGSGLSSGISAAQTVGQSGSQGILSGLGSASSLLDSTHSSGGSSAGQGQGFVSHTVQTVQPAVSGTFITSNFGGNSDQYGSAGNSGSSDNFGSSAGQYGSSSGQYGSSSGQYGSSSGNYGSTGSGSGNSGLFTATDNNGINGGGASYSFGTNYVSGGFGSDGGASGSSSGSQYGTSDGQNSYSHTASGCSTC